MDIKNTLLTDFDETKDFAKTSGDRILNKDNGFYYDTRISAIEKALVDLYKHTAAFGVGLSHNGIFRGQYLGDTVTDTQYNTIKSGVFEDMYIGDYWTMGGINYRIAGFDYWWRKGDTPLTEHHAVIVPDKATLNCKFNESKVSVAYAQSDFFKGTNGNTGKATITSTIESAFGAAHILTKREMFANDMSDKIPSSADWYNSKVDLMNVFMVFGSNFYVPTFVSLDGSARWPELAAIDTTQLPLFALAPQYTIFTAPDGSRGGYQLRDTLNLSKLIVDYRGYISESYVDTAEYIRPAFGIVG